MRWYYDGEGDYVPDIDTNRSYTGSDICAILGVSIDTVWEWYVVERLPGIGYNTSRPSSLRLIVKEHQLRSFIREKHPEFLDKLNNL